MTAQPITSRQKRQYLRFMGVTAEKALEEAYLNKDAIQRLIGRGGELQQGVLKLVKELSVDNQFADEEVPSHYGYPQGHRVKGITEQVNKLREFFPGIGFADEDIASQPFPEGAEGWFAVPRWEKIAPTYNEAVEKVLTVLAYTRKFYNYREGQLSPDRLRQHAQSIKIWAELDEQQRDHDILVVSAQLGFLYRGHSVRRARVKFMDNEFGLGAFAIGIILLTHPERLEKWEDLFIDCAGDEYDYPGGGVRFADAPCFHLLGGGVRFGAGWVSDAVGRFGTASGWFPQ